MAGSVSCSERDQHRLSDRTARSARVKPVATRGRRIRLTWRVYRGIAARPGVDGRTGRAETFSANVAERRQDGLELDEGLVGRDGHAVEVVVQLALDEELLEAAVGVQPALRPSRSLLVKELEVGGDQVDAADGLADVGGRRVVDLGAQVLEGRVEVGEPGVEPGRGGGEPVDARLEGLLGLRVEGVVELLRRPRGGWPSPAGSRPRWSR